MLELVLQLLPVVLMLVLLMIGVPVAISLGFAGSIGLLLFFGPDQLLGILLTTPRAETAVYTLSVLPMFILLAEFISASGLTSDVFKAGQRWLSHIPGGLAMATTLANGGFAVLAGSSLASAATMSRIAVPEMRKYGYNDQLSIGTVTASGTFAIMLPPSVALIIYGIWTETSIGNLFLAGIVPGILTLVGYLFLILFWVSIDNDAAGEMRSYSWKKRITSLQKVWPVGIIVLFVLGGIYSGAITVVEAGAVGAASALLVAITQRTDYSGLYTALDETVTTTSMIFLVIIGAVIFTRYLAFTGITAQIIGTITGLPVGELGTTLIVLAVIIFLGTFMNQIAILILLLPVLYPLFVTNFGYSPIWLGIIMIKSGEIGLVTPPLGMNIYVATSVVDVDINDAFRGAAPFIVIDLVILGILIAFPDITTLLIN